MLRSCLLLHHGLPAGLSCLPEIHQTSKPVKQHSRSQRDDLISETRTGKGTFPLQTKKQNKKKKKHTHTYSRQQFKGWRGTLGVAIILPNTPNNPRKHFDHLATWTQSAPKSFARSCPPSLLLPTNLPRISTNSSQKVDSSNWAAQIVKVELSVG